MGKKSIETLPALHDTNQDSDDLTASETGVTESRYGGLMDALMQHKSQRPMEMKPNDLFRRGWREEDRDKYHREVSYLSRMSGSCLTSLIAAFPLFSGYVMSQSHIFLHFITAL